MANATSGRAHRLHRPRVGGELVRFVVGLVADQSSLFLSSSWRCFEGFRTSRGRLCTHGKWGFREPWNFTGCGSGERTGPSREDVRDGRVWDSFKLLPGMSRRSARASNFGRRSAALPSQLSLSGGFAPGFIRSPLRGCASWTTCVDTYDAGSVEAIALAIRECQRLSWLKDFGSAAIRSASALPNESRTHC